jgi:ribosomal protein S18 acetylase RimI-like enzyme
MIIREAQRKDIPTIAAFQVAMAHETESLDLDPEVVLAGVTAVFDGSNPAAASGCYYVAEEPATQTVTGCTLVLTEWSDWRNGTVWWIHSVYVLPAFRSAGVFRKIYENLKAQVEARKELRGLRLFVDITNTRAQEVYRRLGMNGDHYRLYEWMKTF